MTKIRKSTIYPRNYEYTRTHTQTYSTCWATCNLEGLQEIWNFFIQSTRGHGAQSLDDVRLHVFSSKTVPMQLP